jgi:hypothetical protein
MHVDFPANFCAGPTEIWMTYVQLHRRIILSVAFARNSLMCIVKLIASSSVLARSQEIILSKGLDSMLQILHHIKSCTFVVKTEYKLTMHTLTDKLAVYFAVA